MLIVGVNLYFTNNANQIKLSPIPLFGHFQTERLPRK
jgi:hypothetical protein